MPSGKNPFVPEPHVEFEIVPGIFVLQRHHHLLGLVEHSLAETGPNETRSVYDVVSNELVALANPRRFQFRDPWNPKTIYSSDELLAMIDPEDLGTRVAGLKRSAKMKVGDTNRYSVVYRFPRTGAVMLEFHSQPLFPREDETRLVISSIRFSPADDVGSGDLMQKLDCIR